MRTLLRSQRQGGVYLLVTFPFPATAQRAGIWRRVFPGAVPTAGLDVEKLARLSVASGNFYNIALGAAVLAADARVPVRCWSPPAPSASSFTAR